MTHAILSAYEFKENGDELEIKTKPMFARSNANGLANEIIDCELDPMQLSLNYAEHIKSYICS